MDEQVKLSQPTEDYLLAIALEAAIRHAEGIESNVIQNRVIAEAVREGFDLLRPYLYISVPLPRWRTRAWALLKELFHGK